MIDRFIEALDRKAGMSAVEIADLLWLALQMQESESESVSSGSPIEQKEEDKPGEPEQRIIPETPKTTEPDRPLEEPQAPVYPPGQTSKSLDLSFKAPNAPSLRQPLTLARALKPLMRRVPAGTNLVLDEAATTQRIADEGLWLPVLRPTLESWLDLELVVDESISMQIWRQTIEDLEKLLKNYGIFRDVRVWALTADDGERVRIYRGMGRRAKDRAPRSPKELIDGSGRRLVLVASDCVSPFWRDGKVTGMLELWANRVPTAIIQMLPQWLWKRTALGGTTELRLRALTPGVSNRNLIAEVVSLWEEDSEERGVKLPVFTLEADKAASWAQMLSGKGSVWTSGVAFELDATPVHGGNRLFNRGELTAEKRVQGFWVTASPMARKLAGLLAAAPVITLPVVRLIRETLLRDSLQVNVAEVFLGGLLRPLSKIEAETNPDEVLYDFMDGVRDLLLDSVPSSYALDVVDEVSKYVAKKAGFSLEDFAAVLRNPQEVGDSNVAKKVGYFATVTAGVLRRLGGEYEKVAEELESDNNSQRVVQKVSSQYSMRSLKASPQGLKKIREARAKITQEKGWVVEDGRWLDEISKHLPPIKIRKNIAPGTLSISTWKRFLGGRERIKAVNFRACCEALGLDWQEIVDDNYSEKLTITDDNRTKINTVNHQGKIIKTETKEENLEKLFEEIIPQNKEIFEEVIDDYIRDYLTDPEAKLLEIPNDDNEADLIEVADIYDIELKPELAKNDNNCLFVINFTLNVYCYVFYHLSKSTYYEIEEDYKNITSHEELNNHYFMVEAAYLINVKGIISVTANSDELESSRLSNDELLKFLEDADISIDSITSIEVASDES